MRYRFLLLAVLGLGALPGLAQQNVFEDYTRNIERYTRDRPKEEPPPDEPIDFKPIVKLLKSQEAKKDAPAAEPKPEVVPIEAAPTPAKQSRSTTDREEPPKEKKREWIEVEEYTGVIRLANGRFKLTVPDHYSFLDTKDTEKLLQKTKTVREKAIGTIYPDEIGIYTSSRFRVTISYLDLGHLDDDEPIRPDELIRYFNQVRDFENIKRKRGNIPAETVAGWNREPTYDRLDHVLSWSVRINHASNGPQPPEYYVCILTRLGAIAFHSQCSDCALNEVEKAMGEILAMVTVTETARYDDFNPDTDQRAAYDYRELIKILEHRKSEAPYVFVAPPKRNIVIIALLSTFLGWVIYFFGRRTLNKD